MTNIKCERKFEIDLLAIDPKTLERYHVESSIHTTSKLTSKAKFSNVKNSLDYYQKHKFENQFVKQVINEVFSNQPYTKILFVWNIEDRVYEIARRDYKIEIQSLMGIISALINTKPTCGSRDDILRTMELVTLSLGKEKARGSYSRRKNLC